MQIIFPFSLGNGMKEGTEYGVRMYFCAYISKTEETHSC